LMEPEGLNLVLAGALFSITLNPLVFAGSDALCRWIAANPNRRRRLEESRRARYDSLQADLDAARAKAEARAAEHRTFSPEELVERFPLFAELAPEQREVLLLHFEPERADPGQRV